MAIARDAAEEDLVRALRSGDREAFAGVVDALDGLLHRIARAHVSTDAVADEVVQDTWLAVIEGIDRFEGRSSLRTWVVRILMNKARTRGVRESRSVPFASVGRGDPDDDLAGFDPDRFAAKGRWRGHWARQPDDWTALPAERLETSEVLDAVAAAIEGLPPQQRTVIRLRDIQGWTSEEVCDALDLTDVNQRVLLHRARGTVRRRVEATLGVTSSGGSS